MDKAIVPSLLDIYLSSQISDVKVYDNTATIDALVSQTPEHP